MKPPFASQILDQRVVRLEEGNSYNLRIPSYNKEDPNSCVIDYYQIGPDAVATSGPLSLLAHIGSEPCFDQLRTKETLGYLVWSGAFSMKGVTGYRVIVQSTDRSGSYLDSRVEAFLNKFRVSIVQFLVFFTFFSSSVFHIGNSGQYGQERLRKEPHCRRRQEVGKG
jgi:secreted Zn-dependent insulinase-like peptidase